MIKSVSEQIDDIRSEWGSRLLILGHHYQRSSVLLHADERGDSLELSRKASECTDAERIVFCGKLDGKQPFKVARGEQGAIGEVLHGVRQ